MSTGQRACLLRPRFSPPGFGGTLCSALGNHCAALDGVELTAAQHIPPSLSCCTKPGWEAVMCIGTVPMWRKCLTCLWWSPLCRLWGNSGTSDWGNKCVCVWWVSHTYVARNVPGLPNIKSLAIKCGVKTYGALQNVMNVLSHPKALSYLSPSAGLSLAQGPHIAAYAGLEKPPGVLLCDRHLVSHDVTSHHIVHHGA